MVTTTDVRPIDAYLIIGHGT